MSKSTHYSPIKVVLRDYVRETWKHRRLSLPSLLLPGVGTTLVFYVPPLIIASAIQTFDSKVPDDLSVLLPYLFALAGTWLAGELLWNATYLIMARYQSRAITNLYVYALDELMKKDATFFNDNFTGSLTKRVNNYAASYERFLDTLTYSIASQIVSLLFALTILWFISPALVGTLLLIMAITAAAILPFIRRRIKLVRKREAASSRASGHVADVISNISAVQTFAHENLEQKNHIKYTTDFTTALYDTWHYDTTRIHRTVAPMNVLANIVGLIVAIMFSNDAATMATIFVTFNYFIHATRVMFEFNTIYRSIESSLSAAAEFTELLEHAPKITDKPGATDLAIHKGGILFQNVSFAYPESKNNPLFTHLNIDIKPGEKVALVGHSGGGKTSITKLILRFSDVDSGGIYIDGHDISKSTLSSLRRSIAYVPQDPAMFHRSIMDNIRYGRLEASDEEVIAAAKKAHALEFIEKLPNKFDTMVGERGVKLSGGQRQRIAIARAILKDAPIFILDEATSALDSESERLIQDALGKLMKNRTSIVIAHRLSTIAKLDRIIVLESGNIIEDGTHSELIEKNGTYARLWSHQSGGFIEE